METFLIDTKLPLNDRIDRYVLKKEEENTKDIQKYKHGENKKYVVERFLYRIKTGKYSIVKGSGLKPEEILARVNGLCKKYLVSNKNSVI
jgi:hypothetical protein